MCGKMHFHACRTVKMLRVPVLASLFALTWVLIGLGCGCMWTLPRLCTL